ncbi:MAG: MarR family transcriptional regulator [Dehalococcoidia bacterium]
MAAEKKRITTEEELGVWMLLSQVRKELLMASDQELKKRFGISTVQLGILYALNNAAESGIAPSISDLARSILRKHNTVSVILAGMEKRGLIKMERLNKGKRSVTVHITEEGRDIFDAIEARRKNIKEIIGTLSARERRQLINLLQKLDRQAREILFKGPFSQVP